MKKTSFLKLAAVLTAVIMIMSIMFTACGDDKGSGDKATDAPLKTEAPVATEAPSGAVSVQMAEEKPLEFFSTAMEKTFGEVAAQGDSAVGKIAALFEKAFSVRVRSDITVDGAEGQYSNATVFVSEERDVAAEFDLNLGGVNSSMSLWLKDDGVVFSSTDLKAKPTLIKYQVLDITEEDLEESEKEDEAVENIKNILSDLAKSIKADMKLWLEKEENIKAEKTEIIKESEKIPGVKLSYVIDKDTASALCTKMFDEYGDEMEKVINISSAISAMQGETSAEQDAFSAEDVKKAVEDYIAELETLDVNFSMVVEEKSGRISEITMSGEIAAAEKDGAAGEKTFSLKISEFGENIVPAVEIDVTDGQGESQTKTKIVLESKKAGKTYEIAAYCDVTKNEKTERNSEFSIFFNTESQEYELNLKGLSYNSAEGEEAKGKLESFFVLKGTILLEESSSLTISGNEILLYGQDMGLRVSLKISSGVNVPSVPEIEKTVGNDGEMEEFLESLDSEQLSALMQLFMGGSDSEFYIFPVYEAGSDRVAYVSGIYYGDYVYLYDYVTEEGEFLSGIFIIENGVPVYVACAVDSSGYVYAVGIVDENGEIAEFEEPVQIDTSLLVDAYYKLLK